MTNATIRSAYTQGMRTLLLVAFTIGLSHAASAQPSPVKLWVDTPTFRESVNGAEVRIAGWTFNCYTGQQPALMHVMYATKAGIVDITDRVDIAWRQPRPDVLAWVTDLHADPCYQRELPNHVHLPSSEYLGFGVTFRNVPPFLGFGSLIVQVTDGVILPTTDPALGTKYAVIPVEIR